MKTRNETEALDAAIKILTDRQEQQLCALRDQFHEVYESLKPINLIKSTYEEVATTPELKGNILKHLIGLATGYFSKKIFVGKSHNPIKNIIGNLLQVAVGNVVTKNSDTIIAGGEGLLHKFTHRDN
jgi:hypothetical protein